MLLLFIDVYHHILLVVVGGVGISIGDFGLVQFASDPTSVGILHPLLR